VQDGDADEERNVGALARSARHPQASQAEVRGDGCVSRTEQFGFNFDQQHLEEEPSQQEFPEMQVSDSPREVPVAEQPPLFEGFAPVSKSKEPEIPWTQYVRMVQMFFDGPKFEEFKGQISKLAVEYGTKNLTDTVAEAVKRAAN
jgi:hypothetical protein